jgi:hypothetical protein
MAQSRAARSVYRVEFDFSESPFEFKRSYPSLAAFDADLRGAALLAPKGGGYHKTFYKVVHVPTGEVWDARLDLQHPTHYGGKAVGVAARIESFCKRMLASDQPRTPDEEAGYRRWLERIRRSAR